MKLDWDERKSANNLKKHGVSFETASLVFDDAFQITTFDRYIDGEARWQTIGRVGKIVLLLVVHTLEDEDEYARIISAREVAPHERRVYEEGL